MKLINNYRTKYAIKIKFLFTIKGLFHGNYGQ